MFSTVAKTHQPSLSELILKDDLAKLKIAIDYAIANSKERSWWDDETIAAGIDFAIQINKLEALSNRLKGGGEHFIYKIGFYEKSF